MKNLLKLLILVLAVGIAVSGIGLASAAVTEDPLNNDQDVYAATSRSPGNSVLLYNLFGSSATNIASWDTKINIVNTHPTQSVIVHFFSVSGCNQADWMAELTPKQTYSFLISDLDPGTTGYIIAVAVGADGKPIDFDYLIGDEYVKDVKSSSSSYQGIMRAEGFQAVFTGDTVKTQLAQNGFLVFGYNYAPSLYKTMNIPNIPSRASLDRTLEVINIARNAGSSELSLSGLSGKFIGMVYDDAEQGQSYEQSFGCQNGPTEISNTVPRLVPRFDSVIPAGRTGWLTLTNLDANSRVLGGAYIVYNQQADINFFGANNMRGWGSITGQFYMQNTDPFTQRW